MNKKYIKYVPFLKKILKAKNEKRIQLLKECNPDVIKLISEAVYNVLKGNIRLSDRHYKKLSPYKRTLLYLGKKSNPLSKKHLLLTKKGGFPLAAALPYLIPTVISLISSFSGSK